MYVVNRRGLAAYGQSEDMEPVVNTTTPQNLAVTAERSTDRAIAVTGLCLAFFSTLVLVANVMTTRSRP